jgi:tryptophanyl-tRNA synthetase
MYEARVLSGMRPTGRLHLGHYHGVLRNWVRLQAEYTCLFFVADWHALTTDYERPGDIQANTWDMVIDWLASGVDPNQAILFIQSQVMEHSELRPTRTSRRSSPTRTSPPTGSSAIRFCSRPTS